MLDRARAVVIVPEWSTYWWWNVLKSIAVASFQVPRDRKLFIMGAREDPLFQ